MNGNLQAGQQVLIQGAAGGVGLYAVQLARWKGAQVIATTSTANVEFVRSLGAATVIDYTARPFEEVLQNLDFVLDTVGGDILERSLKVVKPAGTLISLPGQPYQDKARELGIKPVDQSRPLIITRQMLESITALIDQGQIKAVVGQTFPLQKAPQAHELSQSGHGRGRIVLHICD